MKITMGVVITRCIYCNNILTRYFSSVAYVGPSPVSDPASHYARSQCVTLSLSSGS